MSKHVLEWKKTHNEDLIEKAFSQVTKLQIVEFQVNGRYIRMDSKLLGSNIAWYSRYELIHETLRKAYPSIKAEIDCLSLCESEIKLLEMIVSESGNKVSYRSNKTEIEHKMVELGRLIYKIINLIVKNSPEIFQMLRKVFYDQYTVNEDDIVFRSKADIQVDSVQSPHYTDCTYRKKDEHQVKGYAINISDTCDSNYPLNLIANVLVDVSSTADCYFLQPAIEASQEIVTQKIEKVNTDGAYHSPENQDYCTENTINFVIGVMQGSPPRYDLSRNDKDELTVIGLKTNTIIPSQKIKSRKKDITKWRIKTKEEKYRYFTKNEIDTCLLRKK